MWIILAWNKSCTNGQAVPAYIVALAVFLKGFWPCHRSHIMPLPACIQKQDPLKSEHLFAAIPLQVSADDGMSDHCMYLLAHSLRQRALLPRVVAAMYVKELFVLCSFD